MVWNLPKTDWQPGNGIMAGDLNQIGNIMLASMNPNYRWFELSHTVVQIPQRTNNKYLDQRAVVIPESSALVLTDIQYYGKDGYNDIEVDILGSNAMTGSSSFLLTTQNIGASAAENGIIRFDNPFDPASTPKVGFSGANTLCRVSLVVTDTTHNAGFTTFGNITARFVIIPTDYFGGYADATTS